MTEHDLQTCLCSSCDLKRRQRLELGSLVIPIDADLQQVFDSVDTRNVYALRCWELSTSTFGDRDNAWLNELPIIRRYAYNWPKNRPGLFFGVGKQHWFSKELESFRKQIGGAVVMIASVGLKLVRRDRLMVVR